MSDIEFDDKDINDKEIFDDFDNDVSPSIHDIVVALINDKENITLKTEIHNVRAVTFLFLYKEYVKQKGYQKFSELLDIQLNYYLECNVSKDRKSRKEVVKVLSSWIEREYSKKQSSLEIKALE